MLQPLYPLPVKEKGNISAALSTCAPLTAQICIQNFFIFIKGVDFIEEMSVTFHCWYLSIIRSTMRTCNPLPCYHNNGRALYSEGEQCVNLLKYWAKKDWFEKFRYSEIPWILMSECRSKCFASMTTHSFIHSMAHLPLVFLIREVMYLGVMKSFEA